MTGDITARFHGGNAESASANEAIEPLKPTMRRRIARYIRERGPDGATGDEVEVALGYTHQTTSARLAELKQLGIVTPTGDRRPTRSGASAAVLITTNEECQHGTACQDCL